MFGFRIVRTQSKRSTTLGNEPNLRALLQTSHYYQIYENGYTLVNMQFRTRKEARTHLRGLVAHLRATSGGMYDVEQRLPHLPVYDLLGVRKIYADGEAVPITYVIRKISLNRGQIG